MMTVDNVTTLLTSKDKPLHHAFKDGIGVFGYRVWKIGRLQALRVVDYWARLERTTARFWNEDKVGLWSTCCIADERMLIGSSGVNAFSQWTVAHPREAEKIRELVQAIDAGRVKIFDQEYVFDWTRLPWQTDWRYGYMWKSVYFRSNQYYVRAKPTPYDVKFPWEFARMSFLITLALGYLTDKDPRWQKRVGAILTDWAEKNPVAYSINWCAMECAMRGTTLALVVQMLGASGSGQVRVVKELLKQITLQGEFLYRNIEYTKHRSNHFTANITGLLVMGYTLVDVYRPARRWIAYAERWFCRELLSQFLADGVNYEKATSYHRLVTELALLGLLQLERRNRPIASEARERIRRACEYSRWYMRPDGYAPNFGDNDSARLLAFDDQPIRCHKSLLDLGSAYFGDGRLRYPLGAPSPAVPLFLGKSTLPAATDAMDGGRYFEAGGMFISRSNNGTFFMADYGEVGNHGTGGHGHNDTFSFELTVAGRPVIIDPGSPTYTGDLDQYERFRSTEFHNVLRIDGDEMARMPAVWEITNEASPYGVCASSTADVDSIKGSHAGYRRLADPVIHTRTLAFHKRNFQLVCTDQLECQGKHYVENFFYLAPGVRASRHGRTLLIEVSDGLVLALSCNQDVRYTIEKARVSHNYGEWNESLRIVAAQDIDGPVAIVFELKPTTLAKAT